MLTHEITKNMTVAPYDFRLTKLDAFSGASLLRILYQFLPAEQGEASDAELLQKLFTSLPDDTLHPLMRKCLSHAEVKLPAGYIRVLDHDCWGLPELEYMAPLCLRLTAEVCLWTLEGFFPGSGSPSGSAKRPSSP